MGLEVEYTVESKEFFFGVLVFEKGKLVKGECLENVVEVQKCISQVRQQYPGGRIWLVCALLLQNRGKR